jgi:hypothetical protein
LLCAAISGAEKHPQDVNRAAAGIQCREVATPDGVSAIE